MQHIICEFKADTGNDGYFTGYGAVFDNVHSYGDTIAKGAFRKTISDAQSGVTAWPAMLLQHGGPTATDETPIGVWVSMDEDDKGLKLTGQLALKTRRGADTYELLKLKPRPALNGLSIGYRAKEYELPKSGPAKRILKAIDLVECSLVTFPANLKAVITALKSHAEPVPVVDEAAAMKAWVREEQARAQRMHRAAHGSKPKYG